MDDKWFFYLTLFLAFLIITLSTDLDAAGLFTQRQSFQQDQGISQGSSRNGFAKVSLKTLGH